MSTKSKSAKTRTSQVSNDRLRRLYPSLRNGPTPAQRRRDLQKRLRSRAITPIMDFERHLEEVSDFWPEDESCDEFLAWLRKMRREGRT